MPYQRNPKVMNLGFTFQLDEAAQAATVAAMGRAKYRALEAVGQHVANEWRSDLPLRAGKVNVRDQIQVRTDPSVALIGSPTFFILGWLELGTRRHILRATKRKMMARWAKRMQRDIGKSLRGKKRREYMAAKWAAFTARTRYARAIAWRSSGGMMGSGGSFAYADWVRHPGTRAQHTGANAARRSVPALGAIAGAEFRREFS